MKKITLLLSIVLLSSAMFSQNLLGLRLGATKNFSTGAPTFIGGGLTFQHGISPNIALGINSDYHVAENSQYWMNIEPRFDYYFNSVFNGFHVGSNMAYTIYGASFSAGGVTVTASQGQMHIGATLGYAHSLGEKLVLDITNGFGYTLFTGSGSMGIRPALTLGLKL
jgi:hypothetical protein